MASFTLAWTPSMLLLLLLASTAAQNGCHQACHCAADAAANDDEVWDGTTMRCRGAGLAAAPEGVWSWVRTLVLDGNAIRQLYDHSFSGFTSARTISISNNSLAVFDATHFSKVTFLGAVDASGNLIHTVVMNSLRNYNLLSLNLSGNRIQTFVSTVFYDNFNGLETLDLSDNPLKTSADAPFIERSFISTLNLRGVDASELSNVTFKSLVSLRNLDLSNAGVTSISGIFAHGVHSPYSITLKDNLITKVTADDLPSATKSLTLLDLQGNPLQSLDMHALSQWMVGGDSSLLGIEDTPLACECGFQPLLWWGYGRRVPVAALCGGEDLCQFD